MTLTKTTFIIMVHNSQGQTEYLNEYGNFIEKDYVEMFNSYQIKEFVSERAAKMYYKEKLKYNHVTATPVPYTLEDIIIQPVTYTAQLPT